MTCDKVIISVGTVSVVRARHWPFIVALQVGSSHCVVYVPLRLDPWKHNRVRTLVVNVQCRPLLENLLNDPQRSSHRVSKNFSDRRWAHGIGTATAKECASGRQNGKILELKPSSRRCRESCCSSGQAPRSAWECTYSTMLAFQESFVAVRSFLDESRLLIALL